MPMIDALVAEMEYEAKNTRRTLERLPEERYDFKPHEKSMSAGQLAGHLAEMPAWARSVFGSDEMDFATVDYKPFVPRNRGELLARFDESMETFRRAVDGASDEEMLATWTMRNGETVIMALPRVSAVRSTILNHHYHHRGQLTVYLRLLDVPVPATYGPSADEADADAPPA